MFFDKVAKSLGVKRQTISGESGQTLLGYFDQRFHDGIGKPRVTKLPNQLG